MVVVRRAALAALALAVVARVSFAVSHPIGEHVREGPAAALVRQSLEDLEHGEAAGDDAVKMEWYGRGKAAAEQALVADGNDSNAHFALFANWGRMMQTEGWMKNVTHLPALRGELDRALELDPNNANALASKGGLYFRLPSILGGDVAKAEPLFRRALELDPHMVGPRLELAELLLARDESSGEARELVLTARRLGEEQSKERYVVRADEMIRRMTGAMQARAGAAGLRR
jgi:tetratricopeptide (TPR) repeat protein